LLVFVAVCSVFWLFWLSCHYLPSDWLERPLWGSLTVARGSSPESPGRRVCMIFLVYCIASLFVMYLCCLLPLRDILSYCYGAIWPICAESAIKPQASKQTNKLPRCPSSSSYSISIAWAKKVGHSTLAYNFAKYWPIFKILSPADSAVIAQRNDD